MHVRTGLKKSLALRNSSITSSKGFLGVVNGLTVPGSFFGVINANAFPDSGFPLGTKIPDADAKVPEAYATLPEVDAKPPEVTYLGYHDKWMPRYFSNTKMKTTKITNFISKCCILDSCCKNTVLGS